MAYEARDCYQERTLAENSLVRNSKDPKKKTKTTEKKSEIFCDLFHVD